jgi:hypothetical protein
MGWWSRTRHKWMHRLNGEEYVDPVFGEIFCPRGQVAWTGRVPLPRGLDHQTHIGLWVEAGGGRPTDAQREFFGELLHRYAGLWPSIVEALAKYSSLRPDAIEELVGEPDLELKMTERGDGWQWRLIYVRGDGYAIDDFYTVYFRDWQIESVVDMR